MLGKKMLPAALDINRKQGFSIPLNDWLRAPDAKWHLEFGERLPSAINLSAVNKLIAGHAKGRANGARIFALMMLRISVQNLFLK